ACADAGGPGSRESLLGLAGPAESHDRQLAAMVAASLGATTADVLTLRVEVYPYDLPANTTRGRYLVTGTARTGEGDTRPYAFFVKVAQSWARSPLAREVPEAVRAVVAPSCRGAPNRTCPAPPCATGCPTG